MGVKLKGSSTKKKADSCGMKVASAGDSGFSVPIARKEKRKRSADEIVYLLTL